MCDTFVALSDSTANGSVLLAKSRRYRGQRGAAFPAPAGTRLSGRRQGPGDAPRDPAGPAHLEALIDKSFWLYGGRDSAVNEHGVAVGNEAVFSTIGSDSDGVVLIDLLRLILERAATRHEAVDLVAQLLAEFGQGGNCELRGNSHFPAASIVSDRTGAVVLETAGRNGRPVR